MKSGQEAKKCTGKVKPWTSKIADAVSGDDGRRHKPLRSGTVVWCQVCGAFAESRAQRLAGHCLGPPPVRLGGGRRAQLLDLRAGLHPVSSTKLPQATTIDGIPVHGLGLYANLKRDDGPVPEGFIKYEPIREEQRVPVGSGNSSAMKRALMEARVKLKEASGRRRRRKRDAEEEARDLYEDFLGETMEARSDHGVNAIEDDVEDDASRVFWDELGADITASSIFKNCVMEPARFAQRGPKVSRLDRLMG